MSTTSETRERPSKHGKILGRALSALAEAGRQKGSLPEMCATCAFREGCMTNQMAATGIEAFNCAIRVDPSIFACHHGMKAGEPTKLCAGYVAALEAPFSVVQEIVTQLAADMDALNDQTHPDEVRAEFDAWIAEIDPAGDMNDYQRGRAFLRDWLRGVRD